MPVRADQLLKRAQDEARHGALADAKRSCERALQRMPTLFAALRLRAILLTQLGRHTEAISAFRRVLDRDPSDVESLANLAGLLTEQGCPDEAISLLRRAVALRPDWAALQFNLGNALGTAGELESALQAYESALRLEPRLAAAYNNRGTVLRRLHRPAAAVEDFRAALAVDPEWLVARANVGAALAAQGEYAAAFPELWRVCEQDADDGESHAELARCLLLSGAWSDVLQRRARREDAAWQSLWERLAAIYLGSGAASAAATIWNHLLQWAESAERWSNLGLALLLQGYESGRADCLDHAVSALRNALVLDPGRSATRVHLASALKDLGRPAEAIAELERLDVLSDPAFALGAATLLELRAAQWDWTGYEPLTAAVRRAVDQGAAVPPMGIAVRFDDPELLQRGTLLFLAGQGIAAAAPTRRTSVHRSRLRIGYLSGDYRDHPVAHAVAGVFEAHDRSRVEVIGIATAAADESTVGMRVRAGCEDFIEAGHRDPDRLEAQIRALDLDVLVDLGGLTGSGSPRVLSRRVAPLQAAYLGYPGTTGGFGIDYLLADSFVVPADVLHLYDERLVWLADTFMPGETPTGSEAVSELPTSAVSRAVAGLPPDAFVFCNFNHPARLNPTSFASFLRILAGVPGSVLWLRAPVEGEGAAQRLRAIAHASKVDPARLVFAARTESRAAHLARLSSADLFLDTLPYNAHTTAREALGAGLPVLTCAGRSFASRVAGSLLTSVGLHELITHEQGAFEACAIELGRTPALLGPIRARLASQRAASAAFNPARQACNLEAAYAAMVIDAGDASRVAACLDLTALQTC